MILHPGTRTFYKLDSKEAPIVLSSYRHFTHQGKAEQKGM